MATVGFHASHEQLAPSALLAAVRHAEEAGFQTAMCSDHLELPAQFDAAAAYVRPEDVRSSLLVSSDLGAITATLHEIASLGVDGLALHHVGQEQERFIDVFGAKVLPELAS